MSEQNLRIVTWNCNHGSIEDRYALLKKYNPTILVIQEIPDPKREDDEHFIWLRSRLTPNKGVAVISSKELKMTPYPIPSPNLPEIFIPIQITGRVAFNLLAVWTLDNKDYTGSFEPILSAYSNFLSSPSVIVGDFNSTPKGEKKGKKFTHPKLEEYLDTKFNLVSAYHTYSKKIQPGQEIEEDPTFFMHWNRDKSFHIDYCFVPKSWTINCVKIGSYDKWCNEEIIGKKQKSDHCPVIVDVTIDQKEKIGMI